MRTLTGCASCSCCLFLLASFAVFADPIAGDIDSSGAVDTVDVQLVINGALGLPVPGLTNINYDDATNAVDIQLVINAVLQLNIDLDCDGLCDAGEVNVGTHPDVGDTDGDGFSDGQEMLDGTDPLATWWTTPQMVSVPAGSFEMGDPWGEAYERELPVHTVTLSAYEIGKYELTNGEYADVLNWALAQGYLTTTASSSTVTAYGQELLDFGDPDCRISYSDGEFRVERRDGCSMEDYPVIEVSWYGAAVYCNWLSEANGLQPCYNTSTWNCDFSKNGYHLPTEAQWERAAAWDGSRHYRYANGSDSISCSVANYYDHGFCNPLGLGSYPYTSPVGYYTGAASPVGCYDMSGNVWELCNDRWYRVYTSDPVTDPTGPSSGSHRVARGGSWGRDDKHVRTTMRGRFDPQTAAYHYGFRVARDK